MKKLLTMLCVAAAALFATSCYDDSALWDSFNEHEQRIKDLETKVAEVNTNLASLQTLVNAMKQGDYITDVKPLTENGVEVGYQITFSERGTVTIYHGKDGVSSENVPEFGVKQDTDGVYYWTVNGNWVLDDKGNKLPVSSGAAGVTPELKVEDGKWYVSYDGGSTWKELGSAVADGACVFKEVEITDEALVLTMADGKVFTFPIGERFRIVFGEFDADKIQYGADLVIPYTIEGATGEVSVFVVSDSWMFDTELVEETSLSGTLTIIQEDYDYEEISGKVALFAVAEDGTTVSKIIRLDSGVFYHSYDSSNDVYTVSGEACQLELTVSTNREVEVKTDAGWITYAGTKAVEEKTIVLDIKENEGLRRKTYVEVSSGKRGFGFTVIQRGSESFAINVSCDEVRGGHWEYNIDTLYNKAGMRIYEVLGYDSWEELSQAAGDRETVFNRKGEVLLTAYDLYTGEALPYDMYQNGLGFTHDSEGNITDWDNAKTAWDWLTFDEYLSQNFVFYIAGTRHAGDSYSLGIRLSAPEGEARIEVSIDVTEYVDPEAGLYDNPAEPGRYEFTIHDKADLDSLRRYGSMWFENRSIAENIKSTLGKTSYEFGKIVERGECELSYYLSDGWYNGRDGVILDIKGAYTYWNPETTVASIGWTFGCLPENNYIFMYFPNEAWYNGPIFFPAIYDAIGQTVRYEYLIRYEGYELCFIHEIEYVGETVKAERPWYLVGSFNGWETGDEAYKMTNEGDWFVFHDFVSSWDEVKFNSGNWTANRGGDFTDVDMEMSIWSNGPNVIVPAGTYDVYMNIDATVAYFMTPGMKPDVPGNDEERVLERLELSEAPASIVYYVYDKPVKFNPVGMVVNAVYSDGTVEVVDNSELTFTDVDADTYAVTVSYKGHSIDVEVKAGMGLGAVGAVDFSNTWWTTFSEDVKVSSGDTHTWKMMCYSAAVNNWQSPCTILRKADMTENAVVRMDHYGWGAGYESVAVLESNWNWDNFLTYLNMSTIVLSVTNNGDGTADIRYDVTYVNGEEHYQTYKGIAVDSADLQAAIVVEGAYLVFFE